MAMYAPYTSISRTTSYRIRKERAQKDREDKYSLQETDYQPYLDIEQCMDNAEGMLCSDETEGDCALVNGEEVDNTAMCTNVSFEDESDIDTEVEEVDTLPRSQLLYKGSSLTMSASNILVMAYSMKHNLSNEAIGDLLQLLKLHLPNPNNCVGSAYSFKKQFAVNSTPKVDHHYFCSKCFQNVEPSVLVCPNVDCGEDLSLNGNLASFMEVSIEDQLQRLLACKLLICINM